MGLADLHIDTIYGNKGIALVLNAFHTFLHSHVTKGTILKQVSS